MASQSEMEHIERVAQYIVECDDQGEHADMGVELCEHRWVEENFPELVRQIVGSPYDSQERAEAGFKLAQEIINEEGL